MRTELPAGLMLCRELSNEKQAPADSFIIDFMCMNALPACLSAMCVSGAQRGQRKVLHDLGSESQVVLSYNV